MDRGTHLLNDNSLKLSGYQWYGHNRNDIHKNAKRCSGGVGLKDLSFIFIS